MNHILLILGDPVVVVEVDVIEVRRLGDGSVEPLTGGVLAMASSMVLPWKEWQVLQ
ncbi:MAG: hypothetical protein ACKPKO_51815 [Candidatus Fonsibacter sp.]